MMRIGAPLAKVPTAAETPDALRPADAHRLLVLLGRYAQWRATYPDEAIDPSIDKCRRRRQSGIAFDCRQLAKLHG